MKKNLFGMLAAAMLLATSCSEALDDALGAGKMATVSVDIGIPTMQTRAAYSDGTTAQKLQYAVYEVTDNGLVKTKLGGTDNKFNLKKQIEFKLVTGRTYAFVFWAGNENAPYAVDFTETGATMTVDYTKVMANNEHLDAFYKYQEVKVTGDESVQIELRRPFAQINVGTNDYEDAANANYVPLWSHITVSNAYKTLDLVSGAVSDPVEQGVEFTYNVLPNGETFPVADYEYMAMAYVLVPADKEVLNTVSFDCSTKYENGEVRAQHNVGSVPVQRNYRTNIYGQLLTSNTEVNVIIEPAYYEPDYNVNPVANGVEYDNETKTFYISTAEGLKWVATQVNNHGASPYVQTSDYKGNYGAENVSFTGQTVVLKNDIDMKGILWTPIGNETNEGGVSLYAFNGTFDGNGHIIRNLTVREDQNNNAGLFGTTNRATIKNLTLVNVDIMGHYKAGAIVGDGWNVTIENCHVKGGAVISTPWETKPGVYDDANNVGGIVGYFMGQPEVSSIKDCTVSDLTITAFRKVGGIAGVAAHRDDHNPHISGLEISGCTVSNTKVIADMTQTRYDKFATRVADIGKIYGYKEGDEDRMTIEGNTETNVETIVFTFDQLVGAAANGEDVTLYGDLVVTEDNMTGNVFAQNFAAIVQNGGTIDGNGHTLSTSYYTVVDGKNKENYGIYTSGGTIKNLTTKGSFRGIYIAEKMTDDVVIEGCKLSGAYALNTAGSKNDYKLTVKNTEIIGWSSWDALSSAEFTDCKFTIGSAFSQPEYNSLCRAYAGTTFTNCEFPAGWIISLIPQSDDTIYEFNNCTFGGQPLTEADIKEFLFYKVATEKGESVIVHYTESYKINFKINGTLYTHTCPGGDGHTHE